MRALLRALRIIIFNLIEIYYHAESLFFIHNIYLGGEGSGNRDLMNYSKKKKVVIAKKGANIMERASRSKTRVNCPSTGGYNYRACN